MLSTSCAVTHAGSEQSTVLMSAQLAICPQDVFAGIRNVVNSMRGRPMHLEESRGKLPLIFMSIGEFGTFNVFGKLHTQTGRLGYTRLSLM
jgi:hypothetical protein